MNIFKSHAGRSVQLECLGVFTVRDLFFSLEQMKHLVQIRQTLFDLSVNHTQKIQRNVQLNHEGIDHHQVTKCHAPVHNALSGPVKHTNQSNRNDQLLARVEQAQ